MFNSATLVTLQHVIHSICLPQMQHSVSSVYADQFAVIKHCVKIVCPQHTNVLSSFKTCTPVTPSLNDCVSDALLNAAVQNVFICAVSKKYSSDV